MGGKKNDKGKDKAKDEGKNGSTDKKGTEKKGKDGKLKAANSINVRHILVRVSFP